MPSKRSSQSNRRAQGGGRTANSEPRLQVFKDFNGVNFELANRFDNSVDVDTSDQEYTDQSDLQMNFMFLQNNVSVCSNKTLEARNNIVQIFGNDENDYTGVAFLYGPTLFLAKSDGSIEWTSIDPSIGWDGSSSDSNGDVDVVFPEHIGDQHVDWTSFYVYDNKFIASGRWLDDGRERSSFFINEVDGADYDWHIYGNELYLHEQISSPTTSLSGHATAKGDLSISDSYSNDHPFRVEIAYSYVTLLGPTKISPIYTFYANHPVSEWHAGRYLHIDNSETVDNDEITAIELYYSTGNAMDMLFMGRTDAIDETTHKWSFDWFGYVDATSMWAVANLIAPTSNYSGGPETDHMCCIDGRMYFWGNDRYPERLYIGGNPGNLLSVSSSTGGGFVDIEPGTGKTIHNVLKYKTQSGSSIVTMLCSSPNTTQDQRYNLVEDTVSLSNEQSMRSWTAEQVAGAVGCMSDNGAIVCEDGLYTVNRYGLALTTMTMEYNSQIRTNYVSEVIKQAFVNENGYSWESMLEHSSIIEVDGVIYMALGKHSDDPNELDNVLFCYDIDLKAWWTYTIDVDEPILSLFNFDWKNGPEGIGIITTGHVYLLPTKGMPYDYTSDDETGTKDHPRFLIESGQISTQMPQQGWQYLSQLEFHFDYFVGEMIIHVRAIDMFGRKLDIVKNVSESDTVYNDMVHMRIDQRLMSYVITMEGSAHFRMTHFIARVYTMSNKIGQVWGFDDSISHRSAGSVHPTFKCYNDVRKALFT